jgi:hypothetical protein
MVEANVEIPRETLREKLNSRPNFATEREARLFRIGEVRRSSLGALIDDL